MIVLNWKTIQTLEQNIGLKYSEIIDLDEGQEIRHVELTTGRPLRFSTIIDPRKIGRGNPLLARRRFTSIQDINEKIDNMSK